MASNLICRNANQYIACFTIVRDMSKQFCNRCGGDTLTRVTCSTNHKGEFQLHFKKNFQWNNRGAKYAIPKPVAGASNQRVKGGGKGGWGNDLILSEDQKEYVRALEQSKREKRRDLMDEDYLPSILTGDRSGQGGRIKVGAGKHVNSKKR
jgi:RNA-binding protein NOB1